MEDSQPNEVRLARKGNTGVPVVKPTKNTRGRGGWRGRSYSQGYHAYHANYASRGRGNGSQVAHPLRSSHQSLDAIALASHGPHPYRRFGDTKPHANAPNQSLSLKDGPVKTPRPGPGSIHGGRNAQRKELTLDLPPEYRKGASGGRSNMSAWIEREKQRLELEQGRAMSFHVQDDSARREAGSSSGTLSASCAVPPTSAKPMDAWGVSGSSVRASPNTAYAASWSCGGQDGPPLSSPAQRADPPVVTGFDCDSHLDFAESSAKIRAQSSIAPKGKAVSQNSSTGSSSPPLKKSPDNQIIVPISGPLLPNGTAISRNFSRSSKSKIPNRPKKVLRVVPPKDEIIDLTMDSPSPTPKVLPMAYERFFRSGVLDIPPLPSSSYFATEPLHPNAHAEDLPEVSRDDTLDREPAVTDDSDDFDVPITDLTCRAGSRSPLRRVENSSANERYGHSQPLSHSLALEGNIYKTAVHSHDKPRRVFSDSSNAQIMVSTRGFISKVKLSPSQHQHVLFIPPAATHEYVDDACVLQIRNNAVMVLAHGREDQQLSFLSLDDAQGLRSLDRPWNPVKKGGTSALTTMMQPLMFASGGYDHAVHIWAFKEDLSNASPVLLSIKHTSAVHSLLPIRDTSHKLISAGADCNVRLWDLSAERVLNTLKPSNTPYHAHATESPFCTLLEVSHRELQYEIHDHRMVPEHPVQRFGYDAPEPHGRFPKGDFWSHFFASGTRNGEVRLWDLRNLGGQPASVSCFGTDHVVQVLASASRIVACSRRGELARIKIAQA